MIRKANPHEASKLFLLFIKDAGIGIFYSIFIYTFIEMPFRNL